LRKNRACKGNAHHGRQQSYQCFLRVDTSLGV
jgi:hypothetical protein